MQDYKYDCDPYILAGLDSQSAHQQDQWEADMKAQSQKLTDLIRRQNYERSAWSHEIGHAIVAMHYGRKPISIGVDIFPHCLINSFRLSDYRKGVILAAGAAASKLITGQSWGAHTDRKMAETFGDWDIFFEIATAILEHHKELLEAMTFKCAAATSSVYDTTAGRDSWDKLKSLRGDLKRRKMEMARAHMIYSAVTTRSWRVRLFRRFLKRWAALQMRYPKQFAKIAEIG